MIGSDREQLEGLGTTDPAVFRPHLWVLGWGWLFEGSWEGFDSQRFVPAFVIPLLP